jgi:hypothetical protein
MAGKKNGSVCLKHGGLRKRETMTKLDRAKRNDDTAATALIKN